MFLGKTHDSQSASLHPGVLYIHVGTSGLNHPIHPIKGFGGGHGNQHLFTNELK